MISSNVMTNMHIVYHWILHANSMKFFIIYTYSVTTLISLICCKARLDTDVCNCVSLHIRNTATKASNLETIAVANKKMSILWFSRRNFPNLFKSPFTCFRQNWKMSFLSLFWWTISFKVFGDFNKSGSEEIGKICLYVLQCSKTGVSKELVQLSQ